MYSQVAVAIQLFLKIFFTEITNEQYVGCYKDATKRAMPTRLDDPDSNLILNITECSRQCAEIGFTYAGLQVNTTQTVNIKQTIKNQLI